MEALLEKSIDGLNLDRSGWQLVTFGDVAIQQKQKVDRENTDLTCYVKGEHMHSEDLHLREWGELTDEYLGPAFIRKFETGDILYGSRRTYLRKVVIAPFDGITSNTTFVMKANEEKIDKRLLPFIMMSEGFTQHSIKNSKGSVNPYVNWKDLAGYEFLLPPLSKQFGLIELLCSNDDLIEKYLHCQYSANTSYLVQKNMGVLCGIDNKTNYSNDIKKQIAEGWIPTTIGELIEKGDLIQIQDGNHGDIHPKSSDYVDSGIPFVMANTLNNGAIDFEKSKKLPVEITDKLRIGFSFPGDVLLSHKGTVGEVAIVPDEIDCPYLMLTPQVTYYRVNKESLSNTFLYYIFTSSYFQQQLKVLSSQSTRAYVGITAQKKLRVVMPPSKTEQDDVVESIFAANKNLDHISKCIQVTKSLQKSLINQVF